MKKRVNREEREQKGTKGNKRVCGFTRQEDPTKKLEDHDTGRKRGKSWTGRPIIELAVSWCQHRQGQPAIEEADRG
jgi:hypothetical protein